MRSFHLGTFGENCKWIGRGFLLTGLATVGLLIYWKVFDDVARYLLLLYATPAGAASVTVLWLALSCLNVILFDRRKFYLD